MDDLREIAQDDARLHFLDHIQRDYREVLFALSREVLPYYRNLGLHDLALLESHKWYLDYTPNYFLDAFRGTDYQFIAIPPGGSLTVEAAERIEAALKKWAEEYAMQKARWFLSVAGLTCQYWASAAHYGSPFIVGSRWFYVRAVYESTIPRFLPPSYNPLWYFDFEANRPYPYERDVQDSKRKRKQGAKERYREEVIRQLDEYLKNCPEFPIIFPNDSQIKNPFKVCAEVHFSEKSITDIGKELGVERQAVQQVREQADDFLGIPKARRIRRKKASQPVKKNLR